MTCGPPSRNVCFSSATSLATKIRNGDLSPVDVIGSYFEHIGAHNDDLKAYVTLTEEQARRAAQEKEREVETGEELGPLHGVPYAIKDLGTMKKDVRTTFGSKQIADRRFSPERTSVLVERLEKAGGILLGKTNTPEFGHKGTTDNLVVGATGTPFDLTKTAGGSSGGSAAAVAAGLTALAEGSDAGGSIRIPASACGGYGFRPSFGRIPHDPRPNAFGRHTLHQTHGPITRTMADAALMLDVMAGPHPRDPVSLPEAGVNYRDSATPPFNEIKVAYSPNLDVFPVEPSITETIEDALKGFSTTNATAEEVTLNHKLSLPKMSKVIKTIFSLELNAAVDEIEDVFGVEIREATPEDVTPSLLDYLDEAKRYSYLDYKRTGGPRTAFFDSIQKIFKTYDLLITPTLAVPPFDKTLDRPPHYENGQITPEWMLTWPFNWTGHPVASIPAGFTDDNLPVGMQFIGPQHADDVVLAASAAFEQIQPWQDQYPS